MLRSDRDRDSKNPAGEGLRNTFVDCKRITEDMPSLILCHAPGARSEDAPQSSEDSTFLQSLIATMIANDFHYCCNDWSLVNPDPEP